MENDDKLNDDPQEHSIDKFFEQEEDLETNENTRNMNDEITDRDTYVKQNVTNIDEELSDVLNVNINKHGTSGQTLDDCGEVTDEPDLDDVNESTREQGMSNNAERSKRDDQVVLLRRSTQANTGMISRIAMDHKGKDYRSYTAKQCAHIVDDKAIVKRRRQELVTDVMNHGRRSRSLQVQFFQLAVKSVFLTAQMSAKKGIQQFGE